MSKSRRNMKAGVTQPVRTNDSFANAQARLGWGTNNQSSASTYTLTYQSRNRINLEAAYRGSWIVRAAVDALPEDMTRAGIEMSGLEPEDVTLIEQDMMRMAITASGRNSMEVRWLSCSLRGKTFRPSFALRRSPKDSSRAC
jgi:hypothetical protein